MFFNSCNCSFSISSRLSVSNSSSQYFDVLKLSNFSFVTSLMLFLIMIAPPKFVFVIFDCVFFN